MEDFQGNMREIFELYKDNYQKKSYWNENFNWNLKNRFFNWILKYFKMKINSKQPIETYYVVENFDNFDIPEDLLFKYDMTIRNLQSKGSSQQEDKLDPSDIKLAEDLIKKAETIIEIGFFCYILINKIDKDYY